MIWAFKMFFKIIGNVFVYTVSFAFAIAFLPFYLPFYLLKERKRNEKKKFKSIRPPKTPKYSLNMSEQDYEVYCVKRLRKIGYRNVIITPITGGYGADIIAYDKENKKICFKCKSCQSPVGVSVIQEVYAARLYYDADKAGVITNSTFTFETRKRAKKSNIILIKRFR